MSTTARPGVPGPLYLGDRRHLEDALRDGARLPDGWLGPIVGSVQSVLDLTQELPDRPDPVEELQPVTPGSVGTWTDDQD